MRVLVTGHRGRVGSVVQATLTAAGHAVVGYDRADGQDILDGDRLRAATRGCQAAIHLAALLPLQGEAAQEIMTVNLIGTWNVLQAAAEAGCKRVVFMSSVNALGVFMGESPPDYLPLDDNHPCHPTTPYGISKRLAEEMCRLFTAHTAVATICLRAPGVWTAGSYEHVVAARKARPAYEWDPYWEYGAFIDVRDLAEATACALTCPSPEQSGGPSPEQSGGSSPGHVCLLVAADDISTSGRTSAELVRFIHPDVEWRGGPEYDREPYRSLVVTDNARRILGWAPRHSWRAFIEGRAAS